jgi:hypothetical protein
MLEDDPNVVERAVPSKAAEEFSTNPVPLMVTAVSPAPTITEGGRSPVIAGTGLLGGAVIVIVAEPDFVASWVEVAVMLAVPELGTVVGAV